MEPDLDRLLHPEVAKDFFPQFSEDWANLMEEAERFRGQIERQGQDRCRVALDTDDPKRFCSFFLALCRSPVDLFFFNTKWGEKERTRAMTIAQPHWIVEDRTTRQTENASKTRQDKVGLRVMIPTGGTGGGVKFAIHDWSTLSAAAYGLQMHFECERISSFCALPLYHVSGFMQIVRSILTMGSVFFGKLERFSEVTGEMSEREVGARYLSLVPTQLERLLRLGENVPLLNRYEAIFIGGAAIPIGLLEASREAGIPLAPTYGMTETAAQVATQKPADFLSGESGQGRPLPHVKIDILGENDESQPAKEAGRIRLQSTSLFHGYYGERSTSSGSLLTSDLGFIDETGKLSVLGRRDQVINSGGEKIHPREVEEALERTQLVNDAAVFGVESSEWGQKVAAAYVPKGEFVTEEGLRNSLEGQLASYKIPKTWIGVEELPRNEVGKLSKEFLASLAEANGE